VIRRLFKSGRALTRDRSGVTAVEFAIVGPIFLALIFATFEAGLLFLRIALLDWAVSDLTKQIYIGAITRDTGAGDSVDDLEQFVCERVGLVVPTCIDDITIELTALPNLTSNPPTDPVCANSQEALKPAVSFQTGIPNQAMFVRVCVTTDLVAPIMLELAGSKAAGQKIGFDLTQTNANGEAGRFQIVSSTVFMNEP